MKSSHADLVAGLADQFGPMVFATVYRILGNRDDANDAYQEVFLKLLKARKLTIPTEQDGQWGAYLRVTASRCAIDFLHRRPRWVLAEGDLLENLPAPSGGNPHDLADRNQQAELMRRALASVPERDALIFSLRHFEDLTYEEIARQEKLTISAVGVILHRTVHRLRSILAPPDSLNTPARKEGNHA